MVSANGTAARDVLSREQVLMIRILGDATREEVANLRSDVEQQLAELAPPPLPELTEIPKVEVDMAPVAAALDRMTAAMTANNELLSHLIQAVIETKRPIVKFMPPEQPLIVPDIKRTRVVTFSHDRDGTPIQATITDK